MEQGSSWGRAEAAAADGISSLPFSWSLWRAPAPKFPGTEQLLALLSCFGGWGASVRGFAALRCSGRAGQENLWMQELRALRSPGKPCQAEHHKLQSCTRVWRGITGQKCGGEGRKDEQQPRNFLLSAQFLRARGWLAALSLYLGFIQYKLAWWIN